MKKVININFQGTIIPIEETAYEILQTYSESLRRHFAQEEGRDEIINDIETRISELFSETLKKGTTCIADNDVNAIIDSMGRPEDFDSDGDIGLDTTASTTKESIPDTFATQEKITQEKDEKDTENNNQTETNTSDTKRLYRDENHKILGGVCSGIANYFGIDPVIMRIIALIGFSVALIPYIVIWIVVPSTATKVIGSPRKRLFRDTDNKKIAGVCSGLAQYFGISPKIVRILFLLPFISIAFRMNHMFGWSFPHFLSLSFSPAATISYIILWILVPEAKSTSDKLEMKGKPVDLNSIKNTVQNDLNEFKEKAQKWGKDVGGTAKKWSDDVSNAAQNLGKNKDAQENGSANTDAFPNKEESETFQGFTTSAPRNETKTGIPTGLKIFGYILLGLIITPILLSLFGVGIGFLAVIPATDYVLKNGWETILAWGTCLFFIWVPIIGIILWFFRLITRSKSGSAVIRSTFIGLWVIGWVCFFGLFSMIGRDFSHSAYTSKNFFEYKEKGFKTMVVVAQPQNNNEWESDDFNDFLRYFGNDSVRISNVSLRIESSKDDKYHVESVGYSNGEDKDEAAKLAEKILYSFEQKDSSLYIPTNFVINKNDKFRNQRIFIKILVPIGKQILVKKEVGENNNININVGLAGIHKGNWGNDDNYWDYETLYVMTTEGLKPVDETKNAPEKEKSHKTKDENNDNTDDEDNSDAKQSASIKSSSKQPFTFVSIASLISNKFFL